MENVSGMLCKEEGVKNGVVMESWKIFLVHSVNSILCYFRFLFCKVCKVLLQ